jgi:hypothetical protein
MTGSKWNWKARQEIQLTINYSFLIKIGLEKKVIKSLSNFKSYLGIISSSYLD